MVRGHLISKFDLDPQATGAMPLSADSTGSPAKSPWDGVALAVILPKAALQGAGNRTTILAPTKVAEESGQPERPITTVRVTPYPLPLMILALSTSAGSFVPTASTRLTCSRASRCSLFA